MLYIPLSNTQANVFTTMRITVCNYCMNLFLSSYLGYRFTNRSKIRVLYRIILKTYNYI